jgi:hypothetical protein
LILKVDGARVSGTEPLDGLGRTCWARYIKGFFVVTALGQVGETSLNNTLECERKLPGIPWRNWARAIDKLVEIIVIYRKQDLEEGTSQG